MADTDTEDFFALVSIEEKSLLPEALFRKLQDVWSIKIKEFQNLRVQAEKQRLNSDQEIFQLEKQLISVQGQLEEEANGRREDKKLKGIFETQLQECTAELHTAKTKVTSLTREFQQLQNEKESASSQSVAMVGNLESCNMRINEMQQSINKLNEQLSEAMKAKMEAVINAEEAISREKLLKYREKRLEQEQGLLSRQIEVLQQQLEQRCEESMKQRTTHSSTILGLQTDLNFKIEKLRAEEEECEQLRIQVKDKDLRIRELLESLNQARQNEVKLEESFHQELQAQKTLADIFKGSTETEKSRASELEIAVEELRKLLDEASQQYGALERAKAKADEENAQALLESTNLVKELKDELDKVNLLLQASASKGTSDLDELSPSASAVGELMNRGLSLTQLYAEYLTVSDKLMATEEENKNLKRYVDQILQEIEERVPIIKKQKEDHQQSLETITALTKQLEEAMEARESQRVVSDEAVRRKDYLERENQRLEVQLKDVSRQVAVLLTQVDAARSGLPPPPIQKDSSRPLSMASDVISEHLVTFRDAAELHDQNNKLRTTLRDLAEQLEVSEKNAVSEKTKELEGELRNARNELKGLCEWRAQQEKLMENLAHQRDMYRDLLKQQSGGVLPSPASKPNVSAQGGTVNKEALRKVEAELEAAKKEVALLKKEHDEYRTEKAKNDKMMKNDYSALKNNMDKTRDENIKLLSQAEYNDERIKTLKTNAETLQRQLATVEKINTELRGIVGRHEGTIDSLRSETMSLQKKLAQAEVGVEQLRNERVLLRESEARLKSELESSSRGQTSQAMVLANLESIKINLERSDAEERMRHENLVQELTQQVAQLKAKLDSNSDLKSAREKIKELEGRIKTMHGEHAGKSKQLFDARAEITTLKNKVTELQEKAKTPPTPPISLATQNRIRDLEARLAEEKQKVSTAQNGLEQTRRSLAEIVNVSKKYEKQLAESNTVCKTAKEELTKVQKQAEEREKERARLETQLREASEETDTVKSLLTSKVSKLEEEVQAKEKEVRDAKVGLEKAKEEERRARAEADEKLKIAREAQDKYEHEVMLHGADLKAIATLKERQAEFSAQLQEANTARVRAEEVLKEKESGFEERENLLRKEKDKVSARCSELEQNNKNILDQFTQLSDKMAALQSKFAASPSAEGDSEKLQASEDELRTSNQLREVIKYLRRERDVAIGKCDVAQAESSRVEAQRIMLKSQVDQLSKDLVQERSKNQAGAETAGKCAELMRKVHTMDALADSNRLMREEKEGLQSSMQEYKAKYESVEKQIEPLQEKLRVNVNRIESLLIEKRTLENEKELFKNRTQELVEKLNRAKPEDFVKLQQEVTEQQKAINMKDMEINRLKNQVNHLSKNQQMIIGQRNQCQQQLNSVREELRKVNEDTKKSVMEKTRAIQLHIEENKKVLTEKARLQQQLVQTQERVRTLESSSQQAQSSHQQEMSSYVEENKKMTQEKNRVQQQLTEVRQTEEALKQEVEAGKKELSSLTEKLKESEGKLAEAMRKADNFEKQSSQLRKIATKYKKAAEGGLAVTTGGEGEGEGVAQSQEKLKELEENVTTLNKKIETQMQEIQNQLQEIVTLKQTLATKEAEINTLKTQKESEINKLRSELQESVNAKSMAVNQKQNLSKQIAEINKKLEESQGNRQAYEGRITQMKKERDQLSQEVEGLNKKLQMQQRQLENLQKQAAAGGSKPATSVVCEKNFEPPPTANIKPMNAPVAGSASPRCQAATQVVPPSRAIPTASIRPMAPPPGPSGGPGPSQGSTVMVVPPLETHSDGMVSSTVTLPQATVTPTPAISAPTLLTTATTTPSATTTTLTATVSPTPTSVSITTPTPTPTAPPAAALPSITSSQPPSQPQASGQQTQPKTSQGAATQASQSSTTESTPPPSQSTPKSAPPPTQSTPTKSSPATQSTPPNQSTPSKSTPATQSTPSKSAASLQTAAATSSITAPLVSQSTAPASTPGPSSVTALASVTPKQAQEVSADALVSQAIAMVSPLSTGETRPHKRQLESPQAAVSTREAKRSRSEVDPGPTQDPGPSSSHPDHQAEEDEEPTLILDSDDESYPVEEEEDSDDEDMEDEDNDQEVDVQIIDSDEDNINKEAEGMDQDESTRELDPEDVTREVDEDMGDAEAEAEVQAEAEAEAEAASQVPGNTEDSRPGTVSHEAPSESQQPSPGPSQPSSSSRGDQGPAQTSRANLVLPRPTPRQDRPVPSRQTLPPFSQLPQYDDAGDDSIVPSTPTLFVPRRGDAFPDPGTSPHVPSGGFVFGGSQDMTNPPHTSGLAQMAEGGLIDDTRMDLGQLDDATRSHPTTPLPRSPTGDASGDGGVSTSEGEAGPRDPASVAPAPPIIVVSAAAPDDAAPHDSHDTFTEADSVATEVGEDQATPHSQVIDVDDDEEEEEEDEEDNEAEEEEEEVAEEEEEVEEEEAEQEREEREAEREAEQTREGGEAVEGEAEEGGSSSSSSSQPAQEVSSPTQPAHSPAQPSSTQQQQQQRRITPIVWNDSPRRLHRGGRGGFSMARGGRGLMRNPNVGGRGFTPQIHPSVMTPRGTQRARRSRPGNFPPRGGPPHM